MKVAFLVFIISTRRVDEVGALVAHPLYTIFFKDKVTLRSHPKFIPKVSSSFHINQPIHLPAFFSKHHLCAEDSIVHTLDIRYALAFYINRTKLFRKSPRLFVSIMEHSKGSTISTQRLSKWISGCIHSWCQQKYLQPPSGIRIHSTRSIATSVAFLNNVSLIDVLELLPGHLNTCSQYTMLVPRGQAPMDC